MTDSRMRRRVLAALGVTAVSALVLVACTPQPPPPPAQNVTTSPTTGTTSTSSTTSTSTTSTSSTSTTSTTTTQPPATSLCEATAGAAEADGTAITVESTAGDRAVVEVQPNENVDARVRSLRDAGTRIVDVAPEVPVAAAQADGDIDDPFYNAGAPGGGQYGLWGLKRIDAPEAWGSGLLQQGQGVTVAVIDTGVQASHPGLTGHVLPGVDLVVGLPYDGTADGHGHGTHVAGTVSETDDASGGIGVAPQVSILPVRVLGCGGTGSSTDVANGIYWAADHGADVINLSLGTGSANNTIRLAVESALADGVVVAAAGGNNGQSGSPPLYPAAWAPDHPGLMAVAATGAPADIIVPSGSGVLHWNLGVGDFFGPTTNVVSVGGVQKSLGFSGVVTSRSLEGATVSTGTDIGNALSADLRAPYSNEGSYLTVTGPGGGLPSSSYGIYSTLPGAGYGYKSGTSMATPHVAAVAALVRAKCPSLTPAQVMSAITSTAENLGAATWYGAGMVQADGAVAAAC